MKTPEESVAERTWTIRPTIEDEELRQLLAVVMKITGQSRQDALLEIIRAELPGIVKRVAAEKRKLLNEIEGKPEKPGHEKQP